MSSGSTKVAGAAAAGVGRFSYSKILFVYVPVQGQNKANTKWRFVVYEAPFLCCTFILQQTALSIFVCMNE